MALTPEPASYGGASFDVEHQPADWSNLRYCNVALGIIRSMVFFSRDDYDVVQQQQQQQQQEEEAIVLRLWFDVCTLGLASPSPAPSPSPTTSSAVLTHDNRATCLELSLSQLAHLREVILDFVLGRPDLDGGYVDFLYDSIACFIRRRADVLFQGTTARMVVGIDVEISVVIDETMRCRPAPVAPQLKRVVYGEKEEEEDDDDDDDEDRRGMGETACPICLQDFVMGEEVGMTPCAHPFHPTCLLRWLEHKPSCPLCRSPLPSLHSLAV